MRTPFCGCAFVRMIPVPRELQNSWRSQHLNLNNKGNPKNDNSTNRQPQSAARLCAAAFLSCRSHSAGLRFRRHFKQLAHHRTEAMEARTRQRALTLSSASPPESGMWPLVFKHSIATPLATRTPRSAIERSSATSAAIRARPTVLQALLNNTTGTENVATGFATLSNNITGNRNTGVGYRTLTFNDADDNTAIGWNALYNNRTGIQNTAIGSGALLHGSDNTITQPSVFKRLIITTPATTTLSAPSRSLITPPAPSTIHTAV